MSTEVEIPEKVYCCDKGNDSLMTAAMLNGGFGANQMLNSPWAYMFMMYMARWLGGNNGCYDGGGCEGNNYNSRAIATLQDTVNQNHLNQTVLDALSNNQNAIRDLAQTFNVDNKTIQQGICAINSSIQQVGGQLGLGIESVKNAVALGDNGIIRQLCDCCCSTKMVIADGFNQTQREMLNGFNQTQREFLNGSYQNQLATERQTGILGSKIDNFAAQNALGNCQQTNTLERSIENVRQSVVSGFSQIGYQMAADKAEIIQNGTAQTQRVLDALCQQSTQALRDALANKDRELQTQTIIATLKKECCCG